MHCWEPRALTGKTREERTAVGEEEGEGATKGREKGKTELMAQTPQWHGQNCLGDVPFGNLAPHTQRGRQKDELAGLRIYCATVHNKLGEKGRVLITMLGQQAQARMSWAHWASSGQPMHIRC